MPAFVKDEAKWGKAKKAAGKGKWALANHIYHNMTEKQLENIVNRLFETSLTGGIASFAGGPASSGKRKKRHGFYADPANLDPSTLYAFNPQLMLQQQVSPSEMEAPAGDDAEETPEKKKKKKKSAK